MKILFLALILLLSCADNPRKIPLLLSAGSPPQTEQKPNNPTDDPEIPPPSEPDKQPIRLAIVTGNALKFYDGAQAWTWKTGNIKKAASGIYAAENVLYKLNDTGTTDTSRHLVTVPDQISLKIAAPRASVFRTLSEPISIGEAETWIVENVSPDEAGAAGALFKDYTRIYCNTVEYGNWMERQWVADKLIVHKDNIYARLNTGAWKHINGNRQNIRIVVDDGFAVWDMDTTNRTALIDGKSVAWSFNFFNAADYWLKSGNVWYSQNGYAWDDTTLTETGLIMETWRKKPADGKPFPTGYYEMPLLISAGTRFENGEDVLYWVECNSGSVVRQVVSTNQMTLILKLYAGLGDRITGIAYHKMLKPVIVDDGLYYIIDMQCYKYDFISGLVAPFMGNVSEIMPF